jgi:50S ribosomal protein L16 3-hydroxylase
LSQFQESDFTVDIDQPLRLLAGLTPAQFMKRHWQRKPLLVRQAFADFKAPLSRSELLSLAAQEEVESRLVVREEPGRTPWRLRSGPFERRALPAFAKPGWTLLVQGVDLHVQSVADLLAGFRFVPAARLDDLMISYATDQGGVGPHFDSYDVFLLQAQGRRRWRIGRQKALALRDDTPLKILANFEPEAEYVLAPGDMLYLPPRYAHDGIAEGECMTYSVGFRAPKRDEVARDLMQRLAEQADEAMDDRLYKDPDQAATASPGRIPASLQNFAQDALQLLLEDPSRWQRALGESLSEPKPQVWFQPGEEDLPPEGVVLDRRSRMMYDETHIYLNGESWRASGPDARLMRTLADQRTLSAQQLAKSSQGAKDLLKEWCAAGWLKRKTPGSV